MKREVMNLFTNMLANRERVEVDLSEDLFKYKLDADEIVILT